MIQNLIALIIVALVVLKTIHSVYKSITTREKGVCGGCASCEMKSELKKKGKLLDYAQTTGARKIQYSSDTLKYSAK